MNDLLFERGASDGGRRLGGLLLGKRLEEIGGDALGLVAPVDHDLTGEVDGLGIGRVEEQHGRSGARVEFFLAHATQQVSHVHGDLAKVDVDWAGGEALVADGAVVGHIAEFIPVGQADTTTGLLFVQEGLDQQRGGQNFVARRIEQVGPRRMGGTDRLALAAAQAVGKGVCNRTNVALLQDEALALHEAKRWRVGIAQICPSQQLARIEMLMRVDLSLVVGKGLHLAWAQELELGDTNAVLTRDDAIEVFGHLHDASHRNVGLLQHVVVIGVDGDVGVHVAITRVHVQGNEDP